MLRSLRFRATCGYRWLSSIQEGTEISEPINRFRLVLEWQGTAYNGWQSQEDQQYTSVHQALLKAARQFAPAQQQVQFVPAGRTDAGVHALAMVAHVDFKKKFSPENVRKVCRYVCFVSIGLLMCRPAWSVCPFT